ncbi:MAG: family 2 glycosyl transferase, partial [Phototrophicales bacterium]
LILCAGGYDRTFDIASQYHDGKAIIVIEQVAGEGKQAALRKCLPRATGEIIYLTDSDCLLNDDAFIRLIAPIVKGEYEAVNGTSHPLKTQQNNAFVMYQWTVDHYAHARAPEHSSGLLGRNCAVSAQALRQTGGFDEEAKSGTDYTLARQLIDNGYTIYNEKYSSVETEYPSSLRSYYYKRTRWLRNTIVLGYKKKDYGSMLPSL